MICRSDQSCWLAEACEISSSSSVGTCQAVDVMGMGGGGEEGDQVVIGGVPTRPSSASTTGQSNIWEVSAVCTFERFSYLVFYLYCRVVKDFVT